MRISDWSSDVCSSDLHSIDGFPFVVSHAGRYVDGFQTREAAEEYVNTYSYKTAPAVIMEHIEVSFGVPEEWESPAAGIASVLRAVPDDFEQNGIPKTAIYHGLDFIGEVKITDAEEPQQRPIRSEEHTTELQSLMRIPYAVFCLYNKT